jgi:hypothetical protein
MQPLHSSEIRWRDGRLLLCISSNTRRRLCRAWRSFPACSQACWQPCVMRLYVQRIDSIDAASTKESAASRPDSGSLYDLHSRRGQLLCEGRISIAFL